MTNLVTALRALDDRVEFVALGGDPAAVPPDIARVPEPLHPPTNAGWAVVGLPLAASRARVDLIHAPAYTGPFWAPVPVVLTVHDVSYALHPEWYPYHIGPARQWFYRRSARSATRIITVSHFSASEIARAYGIAADQIVVAPLGVDPFFTPADADLPNPLPSPVTPPYVLHVGDIHERRNLTIIIDALVEVRRHFGPVAGMSLVLAGVDRGVVEGLCGLAEAAGVGEAVVPLGAVSEEQLRALYRGATALVYPSVYEGFGLPLIEAMACGTPVIASRNASIPEVTAGAAMLLDPHDVRPWIDAITRVAHDESARSSLRERGLARAAQCTWAGTAAITLAAYRGVLAA